MDISNLNVNELIALQTRIRAELKMTHRWYDVDRPSWDVYFSQIAQVVSQRASCCRRRVGAVLVNKDNHTLATGYNGKASGLINCLSAPCSGACAASGEGLSGCEAVHAEVNALLRCGNVKDIHSAYVTCSPCVECVNVLLNTGCQRVVFTEPYKHNSESQRRWEASGRAWVYLEINRHGLGV